MGTELDARLLVVSFLHVGSTKQQIHVSLELRVQL